MEKEWKTEITNENGEKQTCLLKEKINNENGQMVYRFLNQGSGEQYLLARYGGEWKILNQAHLPEPLFQALCALGEQCQ